MRVRMILPLLKALKGTRWPCHEKSFSFKHEQSDNGDDAYGQDSTDTEPDFDCDY